jgi:hypothetical protein
LGCEFWLCLVLVGSFGVVCCLLATALQLRCQLLHHRNSGIADHALSKTLSIRNQTHFPLFRFNVFAFNFFIQQKNQGFNPVLHEPRENCKIHYASILKTRNI